MIFHDLIAGYPLQPLCQVPGLRAEAQLCWPCTPCQPGALQTASGFGDTGMPQLSPLLTFLALSLSAVWAPHCVLSAGLTPLLWLVPPTWCAGAGVPLGLAQQLAQPHKLLSCKFQLHLPFCLLQPPALWEFFVVCGWLFFLFFFFFAENPKKCCANLTLQGLPSCVTGHRERNKPIMLDKQFLCNWQKWRLSLRLWRQEAEGQ